MISHIMTLANGIIGVSVLAMPFCFKQCGIVLATLVLLVSSILSRLACHFLIKSAVMSRRRNFEFLAFHAFGPMGKFFVELCIIGFLLGTCIAFFVVVGDLGPQIIGDMINKNPEDIRTSFLITTGIFIVLPLGLLRNIDSLASVSTASIAFYICLVFKVIGESTHHIFNGDWFDKVYYWRPAGILQCLPIFALALFCQTQLFEIYEAVPNSTLEKMNQIVRGALNICTAVYICVGFFGYVAFCTQTFTGNILMSFEPSLTSEIIKIGFVLSVAFSFPLVIFPCRASLNSLLFKRGYAHETTTSYISEARFRCLTTFIVSIALIVGVLIPNIEFVLGIVGSTIGVIICLIFPAAFFISISTKNTNERLIAQIIVFIGMWIMILGTYANLYALEQSSNSRLTAATVKLPSQINMPHALVDNEMLIKPEELKPPDVLLKTKGEIKSSNLEVPEKPPNDENVRQEPPIPVERLSDIEKLKDKQDIGDIKPVTISPKIQEIVDKISHLDNQIIDEVKMAYNSLKKEKKNEELHINVEAQQEIPKENDKVNSILKNDVIAVDAIKKEELELAADKEMSNNDPVQRRKEQLAETLEKHIKQEEKLMQEQKQLLKDIEQKKKELQLEKKEEEDQQKSKIIAEVPKVIEAEIKNENNNDVKLIELPVENKIKLSISEKKDSKIDEINIENKKNIKNNEIPIDSHRDQIKNDVLNNEGPNIDKKLISNINRTPANLSIKKSEDPIIVSLTKQSNKVFNDKDFNIPKQNKVIDKKIDDTKINIKNQEKKNEYDIPIVLKMNNQTNIITNLQYPSINQSNSGLRRDILEEHQREKRMVEKSNSSTEHNDKAVVNETEICVKEDKKLQTTNSDQITVVDESRDTINADNLIKTHTYLSEQNVIKQVSIDPELSIGSNFVKVKKRDLKALKQNSDDKR